MKLKEEKSDLLSMDDKQEVKKRVIQIKGKHYALMGAIYFSILGIGLATIRSQVDSINQDLEKICLDLEEIDSDLGKMHSDMEDILDSLEKIELLLSDRLEKTEENQKHISQRLDEIEQRLQDREEYLNLLRNLDKDSFEYREMCSNLLKVREKLNISSKEDHQYANILSIGDCVNLVDEDVPIYEDIYSVDRQENAVTSLYGTKEIRCIQSIIMSNQDMVTEVDNMDDYELFKSIGFEVKGYNLVNQFSLEEDGSLTSEFRCGKDAIKLEKKMNTRLKR